MRDKREIRREIAERKRLLTEQEKRLSASELCAALMSDGRLAESSDVVAYMPMADEIDIRELTEGMLRRGQRVYLPVMVGDELEFREYTGPGCLTIEPRYGINEPRGTELLRVGGETETRRMAVIVPGVAFTRDGDRLGRGRGFYDRALSALRGAYTIGVGYACQLEDTLPTEAHDIRLDAVVTR